MLSYLSPAHKITSFEIDVMSNGFTFLWGLVVYTLSTVSKDVLMHMLSANFVDSSLIIGSFVPMC